MSTFQLQRGDALDVLRDFPDNSIDSIVCDPPYGIQFMNRHWDYDLPDVVTWKECLRVLKPGGHLLAFAGTRTQHRMAVNIEDAGFEIRDMIAWVYGSGFPKSMDVSKAIDKSAGAVRKVVGRDERKAQKQTAAINTAAFGDFTGSSGDITQPATEAAEEWQGWGTALKPALEPITVARKPLQHKTVAANVLAHGTGAINIDACRVAIGDETISVPQSDPTKRGKGAGEYCVSTRSVEKFQEASIARTMELGRWPANLIHDGHENVVDLFPDSNGSGGSVPQVKITGYGDGVVGTGKSDYIGGERIKHNSGSGSAARFFYCAKANRKDRGETNNHPTVKPTELMRYLCRLVTPAGGVVLDPFVGSGSTGKAAILEGFRFVGIDRDADENGDSVGYLAIARARILQAGGLEQGGQIQRLNEAVSNLLLAIANFAGESTNSYQKDEL